MLVCFFSSLGVYNIINLSCEEASTIQVDWRNAKGLLLLHTKQCNMMVPYNLFCSTRSIIIPLAPLYSLEKEFCATFLHIPSYHHHHIINNKAHGIITGCMDGLSMSICIYFHFYPICHAYYICVNIWYYRNHKAPFLCFCTLFYNNTREPSQARRSNTRTTNSRVGKCCLSFFFRIFLKTKLLYQFYFIENYSIPPIVCECA